MKKEVDSSSSSGTVGLKRRRSIERELESRTQVGVHEPSTSQLSSGPLPRFYRPAMLAFLWLLALGGLAESLEIEKVMPSRYEIERSINRTIEEVEKMIEDNPTLPKLSRNDIVSILYNITSKDMSSIEDEALEAIKKTREDYQRALMVVLPYKLKDSEENLKELYTKPPMVQMVADEPSDPSSKIEFAYNPSFYTTKNTHRQSENVIENKNQLVTGYMRFEEPETTTTTTTTTTRRPITTTTTTKTKTESQPHKFSFNLEVLDQKAEASHTSIATKRPIYKGTFSRYRTSTQTPPRLEIVYSTTAETKTKPTTMKLETTTVSSKATQNVLSSDQWHYYAPPTATTIKTVKPDTSPWKPMTPSKGFFLPTVQSSYDDAEISILKMEDFKKLTETTTTLKPAPIFVTPNFATSSQKKVVSNFKPIPSGFKTTTTTVSPTPMREEVEQLLKSIGLQPIKPTKPHNEFKSSQNNANTLGSKFETVKVTTINENKDNSFEAPPTSSIKNGVKNLSPEIQLLFQRFGLQIPEQNEIPVTTTTTTPKPTTTTSANSYTHFKPLPTSSVKDKDFLNFLSRFGLGNTGNRNQKSMQTKQSTKLPSLIEAVPSNMKKILENIGLIKKPEVPQHEEPEIQTEASRIVERTTPLNEHIFKPHEIVVNDNEQKEKIKNLLNTVKMVQEGRANVQDVQKVAHDLLQSTKSLANGPDPLKLEEILNNYRDSLKNEVKRQQEQTTTSTTTTTSTEISSVKDTEELNESTLSSMATTDSSSSTGVKSDQSSSSSSTNEQAAKPSFFDTFDINQYTTTDGSTTTSSTGKPDFFDSFDINQYTTTEASSSDSPKNSNVNLTDLEASFGGSTSAPDPVIPTRPKTGLYFLVDWNTFLEVGEDGGEKVNLRFQPKVGDRSRFIPVKIP